MSKKNSSADKVASKKRFFRWLPAVVVVVLVTAVVLHLSKRPTEREPLLDVFETLEQLGYQPDTSLSGPFMPGNVLQVSEPGPDGQGQRLPTPLLFLRAEDCFSGQTLEETTFPLPEVDGTSTASLGLEMTRLSLALPGLDVQDKPKATYRLKFEQPHRLIYAKGDLSGALSASCVERLSLAIEAGDHAEWFEAVIETVVADGLTFEMEWRSSLSTEAKVSIDLAAREELGKMVASRPKSDKAPTSSGKIGGKVTVKSEDDRKTVLRVDGRVVLGYKARFLQPVYDEDSESTNQGGTL